MLRRLLLCLSLHLLAVGTASAGLLTVTNSSFEASSGYNGGTTSSVPGWAAFSGGTYGQVANSTAQFTSGLTGTNSIYLNGGISQTLSSTFVQGATYTFSVDVGNPSGVTDPTGATVNYGFRNAGNTAYLASGFVSTAALAAIPDGTFQTFSFTYTALASDNGNAVQLAMQDFFTSDTGYRLDNVTINTTAVPEPSTYVGGCLCLSALAFANARRWSRNRRGTTHLPAQ